MSEAKKASEITGFFLLGQHAGDCEFESRWRYVNFIYKKKNIEINSRHLFTILGGRIMRNDRTNNLKKVDNNKKMIPYDIFYYIYYEIPKNADLPY